MKKEKGNRIIVSGVVKESTDKSFTVDAKIYDRVEKKEIHEDVVVDSKLPDGLKNGYQVTVIGFNGRNGIDADVVMNGNETYEYNSIKNPKDSFAVVTGFVKSCEKRESSKSHKPCVWLRFGHVNKETGVIESDVIQIYNTKFSEDAVEKTLKLYGDVGKEVQKDGKTYIKAIYGTFITKPYCDFDGKPLSPEVKEYEGKQYATRWHLGLNGSELEFKEFEKEAFKEKSAGSREEQESPEQMFENEMDEKY